MNELDMEMNMILEQHRFLKHKKVVIYLYRKYKNINKIIESKHGEIFFKVSFDVIKEMEHKRGNFISSGMDILYNDFDSICKKYGGTFLLPQF